MESDFAIAVHGINCIFAEVFHYPVKQRHVYVAIAFIAVAALYIKYYF